MFFVARTDGGPLRVGVVIRRVILPDSFPFSISRIANRARKYANSDVFRSVEVCSGVSVVGAGEVFVGNGVAEGGDGFADFGPGARIAEFAGEVDGEGDGHEDLADGGEVGADAVADGEPFLCGFGGAAEEVGQMGLRGGALPCWLVGGAGEGGVAAGEGGSVVGEEGGPGGVVVGREGGALGVGFGVGLVADGGCVGGDEQVEGGEGADEIAELEGVG